jgi:Nitroreductase
MTDINKQILDAFNFRFACRKFDPHKTISQEDFALILEAARLSPTSFGLEPFSLLVVQNPKYRQIIFDHAWGAQKAVKEASHFVFLLARRAADLQPGSPYLDHIMKDIEQLPDDLYTAYRGAIQNHGDVDFGFYKSEESTFDWAAKQAYIVMGNMMTVAALKGIDSLAIEGFNQKDLDGLFGDQEGLYDTKHFGMAAMMAFGYRKEGPSRPKTRRPMDEVVSWVK